MMLLEEQMKTRLAVTLKCMTVKCNAVNTSWESYAWHNPKCGCAVFFSTIFCHDSFILATV